MLPAGRDDGPADVPFEAIGGSTDCERDEDRWTC